MKILHLTGRVIFQNSRKYNHRTTGFGYMVKDILNGLNKQGVMNTIIATTDENIDNWNGIEIVKFSNRAIIKGMKIKYFFKAIWRILTLYPNIRTAANMFYYYLKLGVIIDHIRENEYDIIHIHGLGVSGLAFYDLLKKSDKSILVSLHGLSLMSNDNDNFQKRIEKKLLREFMKRETLVTTVSTGIKKRIFMYLKYDENIKVILNRTNPEFVPSEDFVFPNKTKIVLSVGNICTRKNQLFLLDVMKKFKDNMINDVVLLFVGQDNMNGLLQKKISDQDLHNHCIYYGQVDKKLIGNFYSKADINVIASIEEGFGLSSIEGFSYGVPTIIFEDLEAVHDIYNIHALKLVKERTVESMFNAIIWSLQNKWDKKKITEHSLKYTLEQTVLNYIEVYKQLEK